MATTDIQFYASRVNINISDDSVNAFGVDTANVIANFSLSEVLDCYDVSEIQDYLTKRIEDDKE